MIIKLRPVEKVAIDESRVRELQIRLGVQGADLAIANAMEEVAAAIPVFQKAMHAQNFAKAMEKVCDIEILSAHVGMATLSRVAHELCMAIRACDATAALAIGQRLVRVWETSLMRVWEDVDMSG